MTVEVKGVQDLIDHFDKIGNKKVPKQALTEAGEYVLEVEQRVVGSKHRKYSRKNGSSGKNNLKSFPVTTKRNQFFIDIGIKGKMGNWEQVKGIYYNHYGFFHNGWRKKGTRKRRLRGNKIPKYVAGSRWMDSAFTQSIKGAENIFAKKLMEEFK